MIDLGVTGIFLLEKIAKRKGFPRAKKKDPYDIVIVDRSLLLSGDKRVKKKIILL